MSAAYTSVVTSRTHIAIGCGLAVLAAVIPQLVASFPIWGSVLTAAVIAVTAVYISTVRLAVGRDQISLGLGPIGRGRRLPTADVIAAECAELSLAQALGIGVPLAWRTTRLTVHAGPALVLKLAGGEVVRVSTPSPDSAVEIIIGSRRPGVDPKPT